MFKQLSIFILTSTALSFAGPSFAQTSTATIATASSAVSPIDYSAYDKTIKKISVVEKDRPRIAYDFLRDQKSDFVGNYVRYLEGQNVVGLSKNDQLAYWLNLQNILVVDAVLKDGKKKKSLKKLRGTYDAPGALWTKSRVNIAGQAMSLHDIETKIITEFANPNVIYGLYNGVKGAPALSSKSYRGATVTQMLEKNAKRYINSKGVVKVKNDVVQVTPVFLWYQEAAFGGDDAALTEHLKAYARPKLKTALNTGKSFRSSKLNYGVDKYTVPTRNNYSSGGTGGGSSQRGYGS